MTWRESTAWEPSEGHELGRSWNQPTSWHAIMFEGEWCWGSDKIQQVIGPEYEMYRTYGMPR